mmetsp:Transcript_13146/g.29197  ORF Transcript_13146/g.29197 Transcript_13146/m.29197 type:complete len:1101 (-) Transcript_13146:408-3710(-)|eukprot:CAMPEP_0204292628 /NCGR_PEP_ID=MMETSP0468-20130131/64704_1 /ASSEMBLY_ACC=CAM_ASM_000383 /TAXON_ID=2969 /ORGANISM="Oxyrrhis marina" /LENGTH=1100 /DNA_ID=CAMNT_0051271031 /DNA_START=110 /DNA_END=3412 /DNA_ORIENTATION=-
MSVKAVREFHGKQLLARELNKLLPAGEHLDLRGCLVTPEVLDPTSASTWHKIQQDAPWLDDTKVVAKPDQLIKRRGKAGLLAVNKSFQEAKDWIVDRMCKEVAVDGVAGMLTHFLIEPFVPHEQKDEYYVCVQSNRYDDVIFFHHEGGVDVGDVDAKALRLVIPTDSNITEAQIVEKLLGSVPKDRQARLARFISALFQTYQHLHFSYLEINPLVMLDDGSVVPLDLAAKIDETAHFLVGQAWGNLDFPPPFGRAQHAEERKIADMDSKTGASLKLTILNDKGRVWTMVAGGGASVVYADTVADYGFSHELANYGEYSGAPTTEECFEYAKTILGLMCKYKHPDGKVLIIGGGIANFTDVAATFTGLIKALKAFQEEILAHSIQIWVRRAGPNYQEGLRLIKGAGQQLGLPIRVYGPETHISAVVPMALGLADVLPEPDLSADPTSAATTRSVKTRGGFEPPQRTDKNQWEVVQHSNAGGKVAARAVAPTLGPETTCIVYGMQQRAVQGMMDFDFICKRKDPSVSAIVYPFSGNHYVKFYWGTDEVLLPVYTTLNEAMNKHPSVSVLVNFASFRSVFDTTVDAFAHADKIKTIALIAEGVPERQAKQLIKRAEDLGVAIIGPATVGGIKAGAFRIGNTGGMLDNIVMSALYRPGSVAYVSKSGGMSNELNNIISRSTNGVYEGVAIGGDRYPGSRFIEHIMKYQNNPEIKIIVLLGEVGGVDEYDVIEAKKSGEITKPLVAWCVGTCASCFSYEVQFGHAGAQARGNLETAAAKNAAMKAAGILVPDSFDKLPSVLQGVFEDMVASGEIIERPEPEVPKVPMDYTWAKKLGLVRKPANIISTISDDRADELQYCGIPISAVLSSDLGVGGTLGLLWFKRRLPSECARFIELVLMVTADHGPAVSGAHNTIVTARAGKDLVSSLVSGLLTIGPRFGGALDAAAQLFTKASDQGQTPAEFVKQMKKQNKLIMGIGHRIKSVTNPDKRVELVKDFAEKNFKDRTVLNFALGVEKITTSKKANLILNVDGAIAACFVDMLRCCGAFTREEADELIDFECLNGLFVLGRSIGFIGHFIDQKRLKQPLYRHPWEDISYIRSLDRGD